MVGEASGKAKKKSYRKLIVPNRPGICVPHKLYWNTGWEWATEFSWPWAKLTRRASGSEKIRNFRMVTTDH